MDQGPGEVRSPGIAASIGIVGGGLGLVYAGAALAPGGWPRVTVAALLVLAVLACLGAQIARRPVIHLPLYGLSAICVLLGTAIAVLPPGTATMATNASADTPQATTRGLAVHYLDRDEDGCSSGLTDPDSNLFFASLAEVVERDLVSCQYTDPSWSTTRTYRFDLAGLDGATQVVRVGGTFGVDEAGEVEHPGAVAEWVVMHGGAELCRVRAEWGQPASCEVRGPVDFSPREPLLVRETLVERGRGGRDGLFLGIAEPTVTLR